MKSYPFSYSWRFKSSSSPEQLWPLISDTNRFFKDLGQMPLQEAVISHDLPKHFQQLEYDHLRRSDIWQEEPYQWEAPYNLRIKRDYQRGPYKDLEISFNLEPADKGTTVTISFNGTSRGFAGFCRTKRHFANYFKRRLKRIIKHYDDSLENNHLPKTGRSFFRFTGFKKWTELKFKLKKESKEPEISRRIVNFLRYANEQELQQINPIKLSSLWNFPLHRILETLYHAVILNILNFEWEQVCPGCRKTLKVSKKLAEVSSSRFCADCQQNVGFDLNQSTLMVFKPHPLIRKISDNKYCVSSPSFRPHVKLQQYIQPGTKHFVNVDLSPGTYRIRADNLDSDILIQADPAGLENVTLTLEDQTPEDYSTKLSLSPNMIIVNKSNRPLLVTIENAIWTQYGISASEVTSQQLFRNLFPNELLRSGQKLKCKGLSVLFTDLINSASIYSEGGDEAAIARVMDHFEILRLIVREERGAIVKTIGDAVMAVFQHPVSAVKAYQRAQKYFNNSEKDYQIKIKGGLHTGDCYAVTLNNRIDFFGNTVNIASRLVEKAKTDELVVSNSASTHTAFDSLLNRDKLDCEMEEFESNLKGFGDKIFRIKRLTLKKPKMRLVM